jgi:hypothetical protein
MKLDTIIPIDQAQVAEVGQRRLGKYQVLGTWKKTAISAADFGTTFTPRTPEDEQLWREAAARDAARFAPFAAEHGNWGEQDDGRGLRAAVPVSIRLAIDPTLAPEGDE